MEYSGGFYSPKQYFMPTKIDKSNLKVLSITSIDEILSFNCNDDSVIRSELTSLLATIYKEQEFVQLNNIAIDLLLKLPEPLNLNLSSEIQKGKFANAKRYYLMPNKEAIVNIFNDSTIQVEYNDGSVYVQTKEYYFKNRVDGSTEYLIYFDGRATINDKTSTLSLNQDSSYTLKVTQNDKEYIFSYSKQPVTQYHIEMQFPNGKNYKRVWLAPCENNLGASSIFITPTLRADYFFEDKLILFSQGDKALLFHADGTKVLSHFDQKKSSPYGVCAYYLPEGVIYEDLEQSKIRATFKPSWDNFEEVTMGPFSFWVTSKDKKYLLLLNEEKLFELVNMVHSHFAQVLSPINLHSLKKVDVLIPPSLKDFAQLYVTREKQYLSWYPSGFQVQNYITLWPLSVTRYKESDGQRWFFEQEIYWILAHEYTHFLIAHIVGYISQVPVWLNEGLAIFHELIFNQRELDNWVNCYKEAFSQDRLLDWELMVKGVSGDFSFKDAQTFYAQSYVMINYLMDKYGGAKMVDYISSFKVDLISENKDIFWKENFQKIFGLSWQDNIEAFKDFSLSLF